MGEILKTSNLLDSPLGRLAQIASVISVDPESPCIQLIYSFDTHADAEGMRKADLEILYYGTNFLECDPSILEFLREGRASSGRPFDGPIHAMCGFGVVAISKATAACLGVFAEDAPLSESVAKHLNIFVCTALYTAANGPKESVLAFRTQGDTKPAFKQGTLKFKLAMECPEDLWNMIYRSKEKEFLAAQEALKLFNEPKGTLQ